MESTSNPQESLSAIARSQCSTWAPRSVPKWYWWGTGLLMGVYLATIGIQSTSVRAIAVVIYVVLLSVLLQVYFRRVGFAPRLWKSGCPRPLTIAKVFGGLLVGGAIAVAFMLVFVLKVVHPWLVVGILCVPIMVIGGPITERMYRRAYDRWLATEAAAS